MSRQRRGQGWAGHASVRLSHLQGVAALMAMNSLELEGGLKGMGWGSPQHLHAAIESMRLGFVDTLQYNADPEVRQLPRSSPG